MAFFTMIEIALSLLVSIIMSVILSDSVGKTATDALISSLMLSAGLIRVVVSVNNGLLEIKNGTRA